MDYVTFLELTLFIIIYRVEDSLQHISKSHHLPQHPSIKPITNIEIENTGYTPDGIKLYQGDMILTDEQRKWSESPVEMRKAIDDKNYLWPNAVVQFIISADSIVNRQAILRGMEHWTEHTCITFEEVYSNYQAPHLIFSNFDGCYSYVGRDYNLYGQTISIGPRCTGLGTVVHEIGHAIGFHHEHSRPDRDEHIVILEHNMDEIYRIYFKIANNVDYYQIAYDVDSIMQYTPTAFSNNMKNTIVTKDPFNFFSIGQDKKLSFSDSKLANLMYNCSSNCGANKCLNSGYMDKHCSCQCPPGHSGNRCQNREAIPPVLTCGSKINSPTTISTPNYPQSYPKNTECVWLIKAPRHLKVKVSFRQFEIYGRWPSINWCNYEYLEIRAVDVYEGERYCGTELDNTYVTSRKRSMVLTLSAQYGNLSGFYANITFV